MNIEALLPKIKPHKYYWFEGEQINSGTYGEYYTIVFFVLLQYTGGFEDFIAYSKAKHSWGFIIDYQRFKSIINNCKINAMKILEETTLEEPINKLCDMMLGIKTDYIVFDFHGELLDIHKNSIEKIECVCQLCTQHKNGFGDNEGIICGELKCMQ